MIQGKISKQVDFLTTANKANWLDRIQLAVSLALFNLSGLHDLDWLQHLETLQQYLRIADLPAHQRLREGREIQDRLAHYKQAQSRPKVGRAKIRIFSVVLGQSLERVIESDVNHDALMRLARTCLAIERHRLVYDSLPRDLPSVRRLESDTQTDVFTDRLLRYKQLSKGYVVYSVGKDGVDDGGDELRDITFKVER